MIRPGHALDPVPLYQPSVAGQLDLPASGPLAEPRTTSPSSATLSMVGYSVLAVAIVGLVGWIAKDLMWILAGFGVDVGLGQIMLSGRLFLGAIAGVAIALPVRPLQTRGQWEKTVAILCFAAWFLSGIWMALA